MLTPDFITLGILHAPNVESLKLFDLSVGLATLWQLLHQFLTETFPDVERQLWS